MNWSNCFSYRQTIYSLIPVRLFQAFLTLGCDSKLPSTALGLLMNWNISILLILDIILPSISRRQRLQRVIEIYHDFIQREEIFQHNSVLIYKHHILLNCSSSLKKEMENVFNDNQFKHWFKVILYTQVYIST